MVQQLLNTLYVQSQDSYVRLEGESLCVSVAEKKVLQVPLHHIGAIVIFGHNMISTGAMQRCARDGREVTFLDYNGHFRCRVNGPQQGNVLLRLAQYDAYRNPTQCLALAQVFVAAKIRNSRQTLLRGARDAKLPEIQTLFTASAETHAAVLLGIKDVETLDNLRGLEGCAAADYFAVFGKLITAPSADFAFTLRTRRPPRDRVNATLSFIYALLANDCTAATEGVGLDPQIGFLHAIRPGRPSLALDLMEEFRSCLADRLALTLINRRQLRPEHFDHRDKAGESVLLNETGRKVVLSEYQKRKEEPAKHRLLQKDVPTGLLPHLQARLLSRFLRGDTEQYTPYLAV